MDRIHTSSSRGRAAFALHNILGHPLMELAHLAGMDDLAHRIHRGTLPSNLRDSAIALEIAAGEYFSPKRYQGEEAESPLTAPSTNAGESVLEIRFSGDQAKTFLRTLDFVRANLFDGLEDKRERIVVIELPVKAEVHLNNERFLPHPISEILRAHTELRRQLDDARLMLRHSLAELRDNPAAYTLWNTEENAWKFGTNGDDGRGFSLALKDDGTGLPLLTAEAREALGGAR